MCTKPVKNPCSLSKPFLIPSQSRQPNSLYRNLNKKMLQIQTHPWVFKQRCLHLGLCRASICNLFSSSRNWLWPLIIMVQSLSLWDEVKKCHLHMLPPLRYTKTYIPYLKLCLKDGNTQPALHTYRNREKQTFLLTAMLHSSTFWKKLTDKMAFTWDKTFNLLFWVCCGKHFFFFVTRDHHFSKENACLQ